MACGLPGSSVYGISQQEYWGGLPFLSPGNLPDPGIKPTSLGSLLCQEDTLHWRQQVLVGFLMIAILTGASLRAQLVKNHPTMQEFLVPFLS